MSWNDVRGVDMTQLSEGEHIPVTGDLIFQKCSNGTALICDEADNIVYKYLCIPSYKKHEHILARPKRVVCMTCGAEQRTEKDRYPYIRMLHALPDMCAH